MKKQIPKTPRQLGEEAKALRDEHAQIEKALDSTRSDLEGSIGNAIWNDGWVRTMDDGRRTYKGFSAARHARSYEGHKEQRDRKLDGLGELVLKQGVLEQASYDHLSKAAKHFKQNAEGYHDLAVLEAAMDSAHIDVQQVEVPEDHIEVSVK